MREHVKIDRPRPTAGSNSWRPSVEPRAESGEPRPTTRRSQIDNSPGTLWGNRNDTRRPFAKYHPPPVSHGRGCGYGPSAVLGDIDGRIGGAGGCLATWQSWICSCWAGRASLGRTWCGTRCARAPGDDFHARASRGRSSQGGCAAERGSKWGPEVARGQEMGRCRRRLGDQSRLGPAVDCALERQCRPLSFHFVDRRVLPLSRAVWMKQHPGAASTSTIPRMNPRNMGSRRPSASGRCRLFSATTPVVVRPTYIVGPGDTTDRFSTGPSA